MTQWIVMVAPKRKWDCVYATFFVVVEASSKAAALRLAKTLDAWKFDEKYFRAPAVKEFFVGEVFRT